MSDGATFSAMAAAALETIEDFHDFDDDRAIAWAYAEIERLRATLEHIANVKIPYCDSYTKANEIREVARKAVGEVL